MPQAAAFGFNTPFFEQIEFFRQKLNLPSECWDDIKKAAHDRAFIVAGAQKADLLKDLNTAVAKAIEQGKGLEVFRRDFAAIVQKHGWTGWTGEGSAAGEAWRTKVIYQTNMATSYAAGRYRQLTDPEFLTLRPYWRYVHADWVTHPRQNHLAWNNLTLRHDHPFWQTHFPPNGWGCHCRVTPVAAPKAGDATDPPAGWDTRNGKGNLPGIDQGFDYAPGATWHPDLDKYPQPLARQVVADNLSDGVFERWVGKINQQVASELASGSFAVMDAGQVLTTLRTTLGEQGSMPLAVLDAETQQLLEVTTQTLLISDYDLIKQAVSRNGEFEALDYMSVQEMLDNQPFVAKQNNGRYLIIPFGRKVPVAVIHRTEDGEALYLKSYRDGYGPAERAKARKKDKVLRDVVE